MHLFIYNKYNWPVSETTNPFKKNFTAYFDYIIMKQSEHFFYIEKTALVYPDLFCKNKLMVFSITRTWDFVELPIYQLLISLYISRLVLLTGNRIFYNFHIFHVLNLFILFHFWLLINIIINHWTIEISSVTHYAWILLTETT